MTTTWRRKRLAKRTPARRPDEAWETGSLCIFTTYPRSTREALAQLAESNPTLERYELERARILKGD